MLFIQDFLPPINVIIPYSVSYVNFYDNGGKDDYIYPYIATKY